MGGKSAINDENPIVGHDTLQFADQSCHVNRTLLGGIAGFCLCPPNCHPFCDFRQVDGVLSL